MGPAGRFLAGADRLCGRSHRMEVPGRTELQLGLVFSVALRAQIRRQERQLGAQPAAAGADDHGAPGALGHAHCHGHRAAHGLDAQPQAAAAPIDFQQLRDDGAQHSSGGVRLHLRLLHLQPVHAGPGLRPAGGGAPDAGARYPEHLLRPDEPDQQLFLGLVCLSVFSGAYVTEIVRAGLQSVPPGQSKPRAAWA